MTTTSCGCPLAKPDSRKEIDPPLVSTNVDAFGESQHRKSMNKYKTITTAQTENLRKVANDKKVGRAMFQTALDNGSFARFLDSLKEGEATQYVPLSDARIAELTEKAEAVGARIHVLRRVRVQQDREWQEAINLAGPNTPSSYNVRKPEISSQYQPTSKAIVEKDIVLLNYPKSDGNWDKAFAWGKDAVLKNTNPREVFAVGEQHPTLHNTLGQNPMYVVAPTECTFGGDRGACCGWWYGSGREARLRWVGDFDSSRGWFAFSE